MSTALLEPRVQAPRNYLNADYGWKSWLFTLDHKRIAVLYLASVTFFSLIGGFFAILMRIQLLDPQGALVEPETYNKFFTLHGVIMTFCFLMPAIPAVLGNFLIPLMIGARNVAFPKLNLLSWYVYIVGGLFTLNVAFAGGVDTGWTFYSAYSSTSSNPQVTAVAVGVFIAGVSSILTGLNFLVTIHKMRAPGLTWFRMPLFLWVMYATSFIMVLCMPVLAITIFLLGLGHLLHIGVFSVALGGDPFLFQHLFWFYSHPAVYIMVLPAMGVVSEIIACFVRKRIFGYRIMCFSIVGIAVLGLLVWGSRTFAIGPSVYAALIFSLLGLLVAIPSAIMVLNWISTLYKGSISYEAPMLYALGFIGLFTIGGLSGLFLDSLATGASLTGTYFVVAQFHYLTAGAIVMGYLAGLHFWWPKISGRKYPEGWAAFAAVIIFVGCNLTFFPQFLLGYLGMPRQVAFYPANFHMLNVVSSSGAMLLGVGCLIPLIYMIFSIRYGQVAEPNPWGAKGLEWQTASPPPTENFAQPPAVTEEAYAYSGGEEAHVG
jgi:cytochrome c oxidase subunit 1